MLFVYLFLEHKSSKKNSQFSLRILFFPEEVRTLQSALRKLIFLEMTNKLKTYTDFTYIFYQSKRTLYNK